MARLTAVRVGKRFGATIALHEVDFAARAGEVHAVVGENGSGKTTLMRILAGEIAPDAGELRREEQPFAPRHPRDARDAGIALIHQELAVCLHLTVAENILLGCEPHRRGLLDLKAAYRKTREVLDLLGGEPLDLDLPVARLSPSDRQRVEIARALVAEARVVIFDEPTSSLGRPDVERLFSVIDRLRNQGVAVVYISHFLDEIGRIADRVTVLRDGRVVGEVGRAELEPETLIRLMVGREVAHLFPRSSTRHPGEMLLRLPGLEICRGEVVGLAGLTGSGRTELLREIFGLDPARRPRVATWPSPWHAWRDGAGFLSEDRKAEGLALDLSVAENLAWPTWRSWRADPQRTRARARHWIEQLRIRATDADQPVGHLSGGNQQKVALARLLNAEVDLLLLDQPTRGIDVGSRAEIYALIDELVGQGKGILMTSDDLTELLGVCDRVAVLHRGRWDAPTTTADTHPEDLLRRAVNT